MGKKAGDKTYVLGSHVSSTSTMPRVDQTTRTPVFKKPGMAEGLIARRETRMLEETQTTLNELKEAKAQLKSTKEELESAKRELGGERKKVSKLEKDLSTKEEQLSELSVRKQGDSGPACSPSKLAEKDQALRVAVDKLKQHEGVIVSLQGTTEEDFSGDKSRNAETPATEQATLPSSAGSPDSYRAAVRPLLEEFERLQVSFDESENMKASSQKEVNSLRTELELLRMQVKASSEAHATQSAQAVVAGLESMRKYCEECIARYQSNSVDLEKELAQVKRRVANQDASNDLFRIQLSECEKKLVDATILDETRMAKLQVEVSQVLCDRFLDGVKKLQAGESPDLPVSGADPKFDKILKDMTNAMSPLPAKMQKAYKQRLSDAPKRTAALARQKQEARAEQDAKIKNTRRIKILEKTVEVVENKYAVACQEKAFAEQGALRARVAEEQALLQAKEVTRKAKENASMVKMEQGSALKVQRGKNATSQGPSQGIEKLRAALSSLNKQNTILRSEYSSLLMRLAGVDNV